MEEEIIITKLVKKFGDCESIEMVDGIGQNHKVKLNKICKVDTNKPHCI